MQRILGAVAIAAALGLTACSTSTEPMLESETTSGRTPGVSEDVFAALGKTGMTSPEATVERTEGERAAR
jgi:hypothetical protein